MKTVFQLSLLVCLMCGSLNAFPASDFRVVDVSENEPHLANEVINPNEESFPGTVILARHKRAINLARLRQVANNVALSEFYRIRGLDALGTLGLTNLATVHDQDTSESEDNKQVLDLNNNRSRIFKRLYDIYRKDKTMSNIFGYLAD